MNERFNADHQSLFDAFRESGDFTLLNSGLRALGANDYTKMKDIRNKMTKRTPVRETSVNPHNYDDEYEREEREREQYFKKLDRERLAEQKASNVSSRCQPKKVDEFDPWDLVSKDDLRTRLGSTAEIDSSHALSVMPPVAKEPRIHRENVIITDAEVTVEMVENVDFNGKCDPSTCVDCKPLSYPLQPKISPGCTMIYGGPGSGKTVCIKNIRHRYGRRVNVYDTDHLTEDCVIPGKSLIFTNRPDIFSSYKTGVKIAFIPYRRHWIRQCLEKCPHTIDRWFDDMITNIRRSFVVRRNCYLSDCIRFEM